MFDKYFTRQLKISLTASMLGISKKRWQCVKDESPDKLIEAKQKMLKNSFDVLPIIGNNNGKETIESYFATKKWNNFDEIEELKVERSNKINCRTEVKILVEKFVKNSREFYFLEFNREIVGLVSIVNLNAKEFRIYLYSLICELEILLSEFTNIYLTENELLQIARSSNNELYKKVLESYDKDKETGLERNFTEYLYLSQFINLISLSNLYDKLEFNGKKKFEKEFASLNQIRNSVAHPIRSLIRSPADVKKLYERLQKLENSLFNLREKLRI